jgi:hypothetical protein
VKREMAETWHAPHEDRFSDPKRLILMKVDEFSCPDCRFQHVMKITWSQFCVIDIYTWTKVYAEKIDDGIVKNLREGCRIRRKWNEQRIHG